jgi:hypothetical protein
VQQKNFTFECFSDNKCVFQRNFTYRGEIHGYEDAMLNHVNC